MEKPPSQTYFPGKVVQTDYPVSISQLAQRLPWLTMASNSSSTMTRMIEAAASVLEVKMLTRARSRHFKRVLRYARPSDYVHGTVAAAFGPGALLVMEKFAPSYVGKGGFAQAMRLGGFIGLAGGFLYFYQRSTRAYPTTPSAG